MKFDFKRKLVLIITFFDLLFLDKIKNKEIIKIIFSSEFTEENQQYFVGENYKLTIKRFPSNQSQKILSIKSKFNKVKIFQENILMKSNGKECLSILTDNHNYTICINIFDLPKVDINEKNLIKLETNSVKKLFLSNSTKNIIYKSNHPEIIKIDCEGKITAIRPGNAIITVSGFEKKIFLLNVISTSNYGLISNYTLDINNAKNYKKVMIVAHPDDETLWGGANIFKNKYFVVCLTNGYNLARANDFRKILKFTNNNGIILNYPDMEDNIINDWSEVKNGIIKDLSTILNYRYWDKVVTHGPDGTTGHLHHIKISRYVTELTKKFNCYKNLYYFGKFYKKNEIPKNLPRISYSEFEIKKKEVNIYKSVKHIIYQLWFHMLPYENWISASKWKKLEQ